MTDAIDYSKLESAIGLNWYELDPNLRSLMDQYLSPGDRGWAEERLQRWGEICGGPIAANAEVIDRNPPRLERYDAWGNEAPSITHHPSAIDTKRYIWEEGPHALEAQGKEVPSVLTSAFTYLLSQSDTGMVCSTGMTDGVMSLVDRYAPPGVREELMAHLLAPSFHPRWGGAAVVTRVGGRTDSSEARGFNRMMSMVNGSRLGVAAMGLGIARRCYLEASIYAAHREAFGRRLDGLPLVQETLLQMAVEVEAAAAVVFEASALAGRHGDEEARRLYRILVPLSK